MGKGELNFIQFVIDKGRPGSDSVSLHTQGSLELGMQAGPMSERNSS